MKLRIFGMSVALMIGLFCACSNPGETAGTAKPGAQKDAAGEKAKIDWLQDLDEGLALAREADKPLMVYFSADWCGWCRKLDREVFSSAQVAAAADAVVPVKVDTDENSAAAERYGVRGLPTVVFLRPDGTVIRQVVGYRDSEFFSDAIKEASGR